MSQTKEVLSLYPILEEQKKNALCTFEEYMQTSKEALDTPDQFWGKQGKRLTWFKDYTKVQNCSFDPENLSIRWYEDGTLNACYNCLDRHLETRGDKVALFWEGDDPNDKKAFTYKELHRLVCQFSNVLKAQGVQKGDRVALYMPMIPEAAIAMLSCARIGAVHSVVFGGFSPNALGNRIKDSECRLVITANEGLRGGRSIPLKENVDQALLACPSVEKTIVVQRTKEPVSWVEGRDLWYHEQMENASCDCPAEVMNAEDPLFILYTSGSTGKPKGVLHTTGGYMVYTSYTHEQAFALQEDDVYWCTADVGWITGHSYMVYGPLANGSTTLFFEGVPNYPDWSRFWQIIDAYKVTLFYTAPTAIRALMQQGDAPLDSTERTSLRVLGTVGEPINPEAWRWYHSVVGKGRCSIVDTWWQTETGGHMILPLPGVVETKPGAASYPFFGISPVLLDAEGKLQEGSSAEGNLCIAQSWPGQMRTVYGDHQRFIDTYFKAFPGYYFSGDGALRDEDGAYWITGRTDDVLNISGHRMGTAEIESALVAHPAISEAAVVGFPHPIKGQGIYAYVVLMKDAQESPGLSAEVIKWVRKEIGPIATLDKIQWTQDLPKTRSGKIMRRILRKIAIGEKDTFGDTSTLANPEILISLVQDYKA